MNFRYLIAGTAAVLLMSAGAHATVITHTSVAPNDGNPANDPDFQTLGTLAGTLSLPKAATIAGESLVSVELDWLVEFIGFVEVLNNTGEDATGDARVEIDPISSDLSFSGGSQIAAPFTFVSVSGTVTDGDTISAGPTTTDVDGDELYISSDSEFSFFTGAGTADFDYFFQGGFASSGDFTSAVSTTNGQARLELTVTYTYEEDTTEIPTPAPMAMLGLGLAGLATLRRKS